LTFSKKFPVCVRVESLKAHEISICVAIILMVLRIFFWLCWSYLL